ncbi:GNAT family N-acetyltransferase [Kribbella sp. NBC_01484]|uniref:GNAT family N-acetyltransferase n=1 Tax=Kribbella sp. NBC_01484 TaxID=2903579 RepID=UPI002E325106|nr:GNAT family N-acetyltransferase [Kribbella sp. NBC_01484]
MIVRTTSDPAAFKDLAFPFLQRDPVLNTGVLSNTADRIRGILNDPEPPVFVSVHDGDEVVGTVLSRALRGINLGSLPAGLVPLVVDVLAEAAPRASGVAGSADAARLFAELYSARTGRSFLEAERVRLHKLEEFVEQKADGAPRPATEADLTVLTPMVGAFRADVGHPGEGVAEDRRWLEQRITRERLWVWEDDDRIVSMVGHQSPVFGVVRVGPVYTPPDRRGHGYASALTAEVTRRLQEAGNQVCLHTDLANPTSNKIYAAIGYRAVQDFVGYAFS